MELESTSGRSQTPEPKWKAAIPPLQMYADEFTLKVNLVVLWNLDIYNYLLLQVARV